MEFHGRRLALSQIDRSLIRIFQILAIVPGMVSATGYSQESELRFVQGMRERAWFDTTIDYLDDASEQKDPLHPLAEILELQKGITFQQMAGVSRVPEDRENLLKNAGEAYKKFIDGHAGHAEEAFASASLGEVLCERARTLTWQAESAELSARKQQLDAARQLIDEAETIFRRAHDAYKVQYKAFPAFIDEAVDPELQQQRQAVEAKYLRAWFSLSRCLYERGQTYDVGSDDRRRILEKSLKSFEEIYNDRRASPVGQHARLMMGRCFHEQGDLAAAMGIYSDMIGQKSDHASIRSLKAIARHYRLMCLNDPAKKDHQLVLQEAAEWVRANATEIGTTAGVGILWEKAVAEEQLALSQEADKKQRDVLLRQALEDAGQVARYPGGLRASAANMTRRLKAALGESDREPDDFESAFERARGMIEQMQRLNAAIEESGDPEIRKQKLSELDLHLNETGRLLRTALELKDDGTDAKAMSQARYLLGFILFRQRKNLDAVIMSSHCMVNDRAVDPDTAAKASEIAVSAAVQAWNDADPDDRNFETELLRDTCVRVLELFPDSAQSNEARLRLGRIYQLMDDPNQAVHWFLQVPESDSHYGSAQVSAGQALWAASTSAGSSAADTGPIADAERSSATASDLEGMKRDSRRYLTNGIRILRSALPENTRPTDEIAAAEVSLAAMQNLAGEFHETVDTLTSGGENAIVELVEADDAQPRPAGGIRSQAFAGLTFRLLLRAYVGTQQIDEALETMSRLHEIGGQDMNAVHTQLGLELQEELRQLQQSGQKDRLTEVRASFEKFLEKVCEHRDAKDFSSLLWIAETYFGLGRGASDPTAAMGYFEKAAGYYGEILSGDLAPENSVVAVRLRLARCRREQKKYADALEIVQSVLSTNPVALDVQVEAAWILSDWGAEGQPSRLVEALQGIRGDSNELVVWGWLNLSRRLQQTVARNSTPEFRERFLESRYELSNTRRRIAATNGPDREVQLRAAMTELVAFTQMERNIDDGWWAKFERLYQDLQTDLNMTPQPLRRPNGEVVAGSGPERKQLPQSGEASVSGETSVAGQTVERGAPETGNASESPESAADSAANSDSASTGKSASASLILPVLLLCLGTGLLGGCYFLMRKPRRRTQASVISDGLRGTPSFDSLQNVALPTFSGAAKETKSSGLAEIRPVEKRRSHSAM